MLSHFAIPPRLKPFRSKRKQIFRLLDVGCGNHSPSITKKWFPNCEYTGLDRESYNIDQNDLQSMDVFYQIDVSCALDLVSIPDSYFDVIIVSHVVEHIRNGMGVIEGLCRKLRANGEIYIEFPSVRSLSLPHGNRCLNFSDDPTHVSLYSVFEVAGVLLKNGLKIERGGTRRDPIRLGLLPITFFREVYSLLRTRKFDGPGLWDLLGFAEFVLARKYQD